MAEGDCDYLICNRAMKDIEGKNLSKRRNQYRAFLKKNNDIKVEYIDQNNIDRVNLLSQNDLGEYIEAERIGIQEYFALGLFGIIVSSDHLITLLNVQFICFAGAPQRLNILYLKPYLQIRIDNPYF